MKKRICSLLLALLMVVTMLPTTASAAETASGTCGENLTWTLDDTGTLTISGTGEMEDNYYSPWDNQKESIKRVVIESGVTRIADSAFHGCTGLMSVEIPSSVTSIGAGTFSGCAGLTNIVIPSSVTSIDAWSFSDCTGLTSMAIPSSVTSIGEGAFYRCTSLMSVTIPNSVTAIGKEAFSDCTSLMSVAIPDSVTEIWPQAFYDCTSLTSVTIPNSVTVIRWDTFAYCTSLTKVHIPAGVTDIERSAFYGCTALTELTVAEENASYTAENGVLFSKDMTEIVLCPAKKSGSYTIPNSVTNIGGSAFDGCTGLTDIVIPNSVTSIGDSAFDGCTGLTSIAIPHSVTSIGGWVFSGCKSLATITIPNSVTNIGDGAFSGCTGLTSVIIPDGVTDIGDFTFSDCTGLTNVVIPNSVTDIGRGAFEGCTSLISIEIPSSVSGIWVATFRNCTSLGSVTIPESVTGIGPGAFDGCTSLESVTIPDSVTEIGYEAFANCSRLKNAKLPNKLKEIDMGVFFDCAALKKVEIPDAVTDIGSSAFSGCTSLTAVGIPSTVNWIREDSFANCTALKDVYYSGTEDQWNAIRIENGNDALKNVTIHFQQSLPQPPAGPGGTITVVPAYQAQPGETVTVKLNLSANKGISNMRLQLTYPEGFTVEKVQKGNALSALNFTPPGILTANPVNFVWDGTAADTSEGCILELTFRVANTVAEGGHNISLSYQEGDVLDGDMNEIQLELNQGEVQVWCQHSVKATRYAQAATCTTAGNSEYYICCACGKYFSDVHGENEIAEDSWVIDALGHDIVTDEAVSATCTETGLTEGSHCTRCGTVLKAQTETPALGHDYKNGTCTRCGAKDPNNKPAAPAVKPDYLLSTGKPYLKWKAVDGAVKYYVYRSGSKNGTYKYIGTATKLNYTDTTAKPGYYYYYKVKAVTASGVKSNYSMAVTALCHCARPALNGAQYLASTGKPYLSWGAVTGAGKYYVYRAGSQNGAYKYIGSTTKTNYTDTTASAGYTYYYKVEAVSKVRGAANSANSKALAVNSHCARPVVKPDYLASTGKPYLKWSAVTGASKYEVYRAGSQNGTYKYIGSTTKTGYTDTTASAGYAYYYKVKAISNVKSTANSSYSTVVKATCHCAKPVVKIALTQKGDPKLTWNAVAGASKYEVYRSTSKNGTYTKMFTTTNRSYTNTNARAGTTYYYKVKAISRVRSTANSSFSAIKSIRAR